MTPFDELRIRQLLSAYDLKAPPALPLEFGDYLSILWRLDRAAEQGVGIVYYRRCEQVLCTALDLAGTTFGKLVRTTLPGSIYEALPNLPYRDGERRVDAADRKAAIAQLLRMRADILHMGSYQQTWATRWPGSGIQDPELQERMFAILFSAMPSQFMPFSRLLYIIDIVLQELLLGTRRGEGILLHTLVAEHGYPDPAARETAQLLLQKE